MTTELITMMEVNGTVSYEVTESSGVQGGNPSVETWLVPLIFAIITVIGVTGNAIVCYVILRHAQMRTPTNYYIMNLAITDLAFLLCCAPFTASIYATQHWMFGRALCKIFNYVIQVTAQATCMILTAMTIDRYQAIMRPLRSLGTRTQSGVLVVCGCIWAVSALIAIPVPVYFDVVTMYFGSVCFEIWPHPFMYPGFALYTAVIMYIVPLWIIVTCYLAMLRTLWKTTFPGDEATNANSQHQGRTQHQRRKVTLMVMCVVIVFAVCWLPVHVLNLYFRFDEKNFPKTDAMYAFKAFAHILTYANSCINPIVYAFMGRNFRKYLRKECACCLASYCWFRRNGSHKGRLKLNAPEERAMATFKSANNSSGNTHSTTVLPLVSRNSRSSQS